MNSVTSLLLNNPDISPWESNNNFDYDRSKCVKSQKDPIESDHQVNELGYTNSLNMFLVLR